VAYTELACYCDSVAYTAVAQWAATHAYTVGQIVRQLAAPTANNERCFLCIVAGTSLSTEPAWVLTRGAKTVEAAGPTWMECTGLPALCADNTNTNAWHASAGSIALGWIIKNVANDHYFIATTAGTGGTGTEPAWSTTTGATTADATVTWTCIGATSSFVTKLAAPHARLTTPVNNNSPWLPNAKMNIYVGDDHSETNAAGTYYYCTQPLCNILCFDHTVALPPGSANLKATAQIIATTGFNFLYNISGPNYVYGIQFSASGAGTGVGICNSTQSRNVLERCTFSITGTGNNTNFSFGDNSTGSPLLLKDCTFSIANVSNGQQFILQSPVKIENCTFTATLGTAGLPLLNAGNNPTAVLEGCDFSGVPSSAFLTSGGQGGSWTFKDCIIPAGMVISSGAGGLPTADNVTIDLNRVDSGTAVYRNERYRFEGKTTTATGVVRTGGASDGATPVSHQIATNANTNNIQRIFNSVPFAIWNAVTGANRNVTVYGIANDSRVPTNDEVWFDVEYLGSATSPKGSYARGGKANVLAAGSALTADTSAWDSAATARANTTAYTVGQVLKTASNPGRIFFCTQAGTSAASEPAGGATTWNPSDATGTITFSNGNLTAQSGASGQAVRSNYGAVAGKLYWEYTVTTPNSVALGIGNSSTVLSTVASTGVNSCIFNVNGQIVVNNTTVIGNIGVVSSGAIIGVALDVVNQLIWFRNGASGSWNATSGSANNPATGTGGISISAIASGALYALFAAAGAVAAATANFGASGFAGTVPSGFTAWNTVSLIGYSAAADGNSIVDGTAVFRAGCRFSQTLTLSAPQPQQAGYIYTYPRIGRPSLTYYLDPLIVLS
jgi:hypothetical protein